MTMNRTSLAQLTNLVERESIDGAKLVENPHDNPICLLSYDATVCCVTDVWRKYATSAQFRLIHEAILDMLVLYKSEKVLGDDTALPVIHAEDQKWIIEERLTRAKAAGLKALATTVSRSFYGRLTIGSVQAGMAREIAINAFPIIQLALNWLQKFRD